MTTKTITFTVYTIGVWKIRADPRRSDEPELPSCVPDSDLVIVFLIELQSIDLTVLVSVLKHSKHRNLF